MVPSVFPGGWIVVRSSAMCCDDAEFAMTDEGLTVLGMSRINPLVKLNADLSRYGLKAIPQ